MPKRKRRKIIKHPTIRKLRNRGITPLRYKSEEGAITGWIEKRGYKWLYFRHAGDQSVRMKLPLTEERYMEEL